MTELPQTDVIDTELSGEWLTIWFNQPEQRNPMTDAMMAEFIAVLEAVRDDRSVRGITVRGRGGVFCAGGDLKTFRDKYQTGAPREDVLAMSRNAASIMDHFNSAPQVTIALVEGAAMAGGFGLMCCADVAIVQSDARFAMTETMIGLTPAQISPFIIQRLGYAAARRLMLTAARFKGEEAVKLGVADYAANNVGDLEAYEAQIRKQVLGCAPGAIAATKDLILKLPGLLREETIAAAAENFTARMTDPEAVEGIASFFEKRKPNWAPK